MIRNLLITAMFAPSLAQAFCFERAAQAYQLDPALLRAVAHVESSMKQHAMNTSHAEKTGSVDIGLMQINSRWLPKLATFGITREMLEKDACQNLLVGAWIMKDALNRQGDNWWGVGSYNASCTSLKGKDCERARYAYAWKVYRAMQKQSAEQAAEQTTGAPVKAGGRAQLAARQKMNRQADKPRIESVHFDDVVTTSSARIGTSEAELVYAQSSQLGSDGDGDNDQEITN